MLSLEAGGFSCTFACKSFMEQSIAILIKKVFFVLNFSFWVIKNGDRIRIQITEGLDPDASPDLMNMDPQHCLPKICLELSIKNVVMVFL
jgi:hypothetical protein